MKKTELESKAIKFTVERDGIIVGRVFLFIIFNDLHGTPYGLMEDLFVDEAYRGQGIGKELVKCVVAEAREQGCSKLIGQSRYGRDQVHAMYEKLGFRDHGKNFRMDFE